MPTVSRVFHFSFQQKLHKLRNKTSLMVFFLSLSPVLIGTFMFVFIMIIKLHIANITFCFRTIVLFFANIIYLEKITSDFLSCDMQLFL